jgi:hypothetical protein
MHYYVIDKGAFGSFHLTTDTTKERVYSSGLIGIRSVAVAGTSGDLAAAPKPSYFPFVIFA